MICFYIAMVVLNKSLVVYQIKAAKENGVNIATPRIGQTVKFEDIASYNEAWRKHLYYIFLSKL